MHDVFMLLRCHKYASLSQYIILYNLQLFKQAYDRGRPMTTHLVQIADSEENKTDEMEEKLNDEWEGEERED